MSVVLDVDVERVFKALLPNAQHDEDDCLERGGSDPFEGQQEDETFQSKQNSVEAEVGEQLQQVADELDRTDPSATHRSQEVLQSLRKGLSDGDAKQFFYQAAEKSYLSSTDEGLACVGAVFLLAKTTMALLQGENMTEYMPKVTGWTINFVKDRLGTVFRKTDEGSWNAKNPESPKAEEPFSKVKPSIK
eukprot:m.307574 g.307574  ORF g.307574 m.307574 type:complete len:190 (+) comp42475_c0_seq1:62-631(+)